MSRPKCRGTKCWRYKMLWDKMSRPYYKHEEEQENRLSVTYFKKTNQSIAARNNRAFTINGKCALIMRANRQNDHYKRIQLTAMASSSSLSSQQSDLCLRFLFRLPRILSFICCPEVCPLCSVLSFLLFVAFVLPIPFPQSAVRHFVVLHCDTLL